MTLILGAYCETVLIVEQQAHHELCGLVDIDLQVVVTMWPGLYQSPIIYSILNEYWQTWM